MGRATNSAVSDSWQNLILSQVVEFVATLRSVSAIINQLTMDEYLSYFGTQLTNRQVFLLNCSDDVRAFSRLLSALRNAWTRLGVERDTAGKSHVGLLLFANVLSAHVLVGFQHVSSYQSFLAWSTFRPGLEALLIIGKFLDDPANAGIWKNRQTDPHLYRKTFSGKSLESVSLPKSSVFRRVLTRLNDDFMHPNPHFAYRGATQTARGTGVQLDIQLFDTAPDIHEAHLLSYMNLLDCIVSASEGLVNNLCGKTAVSVRHRYTTHEQPRATQLASRSVAGKRIMEELGLWSFGHSDDLQSSYKQTSC